MSYMPISRRGGDHNDAAGSADNSRRRPPGTYSQWRPRQSQHSSSHRHGSHYEPPPDARHYDDIIEYFWPSSNDESKASESSSHAEGRGTLNDSAARPGQLAFVLLHNGANPQWDEEKVIYAKSKLELLNGLEGITTHTPPADGLAEPQRPSDANTGTRPDVTQSDDAAESDGKAQVSNEMAGAETVHGEKSENGGQAADTHAETQVDGSGATPTPSSPCALTSKDTAQITQQLIPVSTPSAPVAFFSHPSSAPAQSSSFIFIGYFRPTHLIRHSPYSDATKAMLERKWSFTDRFGRVVSKRRDVSAWKASLALEWVELYFERDKQWEEEYGPPSIVKNERPARQGAERRERGLRQRRDQPSSEGHGSEGRSVNELLAEMRLQDGFAGKGG